MPRLPPLLLSGGLFLLLACLYCLLFREFPRDSDSAANFLAGVDWFRGNWRLKNWTLPSDNFLNSDLLLYGLLSRLFGVRIEVCYYSAALIWAGVVTLAVALAARLSVARQPGWSILSVLTLLGLPLLHCNPALVLITYSPYHNGSMVYLLASLLCLELHLRKGSWVWLLAYFALMTANCFGDPMIVVLGVLPVLAAIAYHQAISGWRNRSYWQIAGVSLAAVVVARVLLAWMKSDGFHSEPLPLGFSEFAQFGKNIEVVTHGVFVFAGADFWGHKLSLAELLPLAMIASHLPILGFQLHLFVKETTRRTELKPDSELILSVLYFIVLLNLGAGLLSSSVFRSDHVRYLTPAFIALNILLAVHGPLQPLYRNYLKVCFAVTLSYTLGVAAFRVGAPPANGSGEQLGAVSKLTEMKLKSGFGYFWDAGLTTVLSREELLTRPLMVDGAGKVHPYNWTATTDWFGEQTYTEPQFYVITRTEGPFEFLTREQAVQFFGPPKQEIPIWTSVLILIYDTARARPLLQKLDQEARQNFQKT